MSTVQSSLKLSFADMSYHEIDFVGRVDDDDIDIDIDLETGRNDEDYILEDVNSDGDHENALIVNDDVMIDDENVSYPMDDVEALHSEHVEMEDADLSHTTAMDPHNAETNMTLATNTFNYADGLHGIPKTTLDVSPAKEEHLRDIEAPRISDHKDLVEEDGPVGNELANVESIHSPPTSPQNDVLEFLTGAGQNVTKFISTHSHSLETDPTEQENSDVISAPEVIPAVGPAQDEIEAVSGETDDVVIGADKVVVIYQDVEYALFSTTESDDPDTFFLKDSSLVNGSLGDLLAGLRSVIHEDLGSEDELCLAVEDLGIEISETCVSVRGVNFASVINLHQRLLMNDGLEASATLFVTLGTKPDFAKRLANLATGAAAGKGLSDLTSWEESSEILEEDEGALQVGGNVSLKSTNQVVEASKYSKDSPGNHFIHDVTEEARLSENSNPKQNLGKNGRDAEILDHSFRDQTPQHHDPLALLANDSTNTSIQAQEITGHNSLAEVADVIRSPKNDRDEEGEEQGEDEEEKEEVEEGDLIDYEDEEYEQSREILIAANVDGNTNSNEEQFALNTYSVPLVTEGGESEIAPNVDAGRSPSTHSSQYSNRNISHEANIDHAPLSEVQYPYQHEKGKDLEQDGEEFPISYDEDEGKELEEGENESVWVENISTNPEETLNSIEPDLKTGPAETKDDDLGELDYNTTSQELTYTYHSGNGIASVAENQHSTILSISGSDEEADEISYEDENFLDANESNHALVADQSRQDSTIDGSGISQNDEINYESDSQDDLKSHSYLKNSAGTSPTSNVYSGKRQRGDADDATERTSKQTKRVRS